MLPHSTFSQSSLCAYRLLIEYCEIKNKRDNAQDKQRILKKKNGVLTRGPKILQTYESKSMVRAEGQSCIIKLKFGGKINNDPILEFNYPIIKFKRLCCFS